MYWVLFSSGARPQYLENDARSLALFPDSILQFRYEQRIVSDKFKDAVAKDQITGQTAYLAYIDTRERLPKPKFVLLREARIEGCELRGSSYIIKLAIKKYIKQTECDLDAIVRSTASEQLPDYIDQKSTGFWAASISQSLPDSVLVPHDYDRALHLNAFEETADRLSSHADFQTDERRLFLNLIDIRDKRKKSVVFPTAKKLRGGETYTLSIYHYYRVTSGKRDWTPFWVISRSNSANLTFRSDTSMKVESEYDQREIVFTINRNADFESVAIDLRLTPVREDAASVLDVHLPFDVLPRVLERWVRIGMITAGLSFAQTIALFTEGHVHLDAMGGLTLVVVLGASLVAAIASVSGYKHDV